MAHAITAIVQRGANLQLNFSNDALAACALVTSAIMRGTVLSSIVFGEKASRMPQDRQAVVIRPRIDEPLRRKQLSASCAVRSSGRF
jgi:hypothetical protein